MNDETLPLVSVVIPTYNRRDLLVAAVRSVLDQRRIRLEVIVADDASTDGTRSAMEGLGDPRVRVVQNESRRGVSLTRNEGIARARGDWVALLDDDDLWAPEKLCSLVEAAVTSGRTWAISGAVAVDDQLRILSGGPPPSIDTIRDDLLRRNVIPAGASNVVVTRALLEQLCGFDPELRHLSDWDLWIRLNEMGPPCIVERPLVAYRVHSGNASADTAQIAVELDIIDDRYADRRSGTKLDRAYVHRWIAWNCLRTGRRADAAREYVLAARDGDPFSLLRAAAGLVYPNIVWRAIGRGPSRPGWNEAAEEWLAPMRGS